MTTPRKTGAPPLQEQRSVMDKINALVLKGVLGVLGTIIWMLVTDVRTDVKQLLVAVTKNEVRIQHLEDDVKGLKTGVFSQARDAGTAMVQETHDPYPPVGVMPESSYFIRKEDDQFEISENAKRKYRELHLVL